MDIEKVNAVLVKAIVGLQEVESEEIIEAMAWGVTGKYDVPAPGTIGAGEMKGGIDKSKDVVDDSVGENVRYGDAKLQGIKPAKKGKLNKTQKKVLGLFKKMEYEGPWGALLLVIGRHKKLKKNEVKALVSLVAGGLLKVYRFKGPSPVKTIDDPHWQTRDFHYRIFKEG